MGAEGSFVGSTAATPPPTGARRYTLLRRLAVGGMGELLLARAASARGVQKLVAIKRVRPEYASDPEFVSMFVNEARLAATLDHPNVVRTYDLVEDVPYGAYDHDTTFEPDDFERPTGPARNAPQTSVESSPST